MWCARSKWAVAVLWGLVLGLPAAEAHAGAIGAGPWWAQWQLHPFVVTNLVFLAALYTLGWRRRRRLGGGQGPLARWRAWVFGAGLVALALALLSPLDAFANELLWVHMIQHLVLMNIAAPLIVLGAPGRVLWWAFADERRLEWARWRRLAGRYGWRGYLIWQPLVLWALYAAVLWIWHLPALYETAVRQPWVHDLQHLAFFGSAALFWRVLFDPLGQRRMGRMSAVLYLFTTSLHTALLGVFMALAPRLWYPVYTESAPRWGWEPLVDQQLAGYLMWMPAGMAYALTAVLVLAQALREPREQAGASAGA